MSEQDDARRNAREDVAKNIKLHDEKHGRHTSYDQAYKQACERADVIDKKRDWKEMK